MSDHGGVPDHSIYSTKYQATLKRSIYFEIVSLFGRLFMGRRPPLVDPGTKLLHLGCGNILFEGWVNADMFLLCVRSWKIPKSRWMLDLRYPMRCDSNYWDGIFTEHTLEHLYPTDARNLLKELLRTLKPNCCLRICVPDLRKYIDYYSGKPSHDRFVQWATGAEAMRSLTQNWGHLSVWDSELLERTLHEVGFVDVKQVDFLEGRDKNLIKDNAARSWESLYIEARKPSHTLERDAGS